MTPDLAARIRALPEPVRAVVNLDAALLAPTGILLPPLTPGGEPALWSIE